MRVLVAGAHGRLGSRVVALLLSRGQAVRCLVRKESQADALRGAGAEAVVADLRGDVEWTMDGCDAAVFAASARRAGDLASVDAGGAAKLAEAAHRYEASRFIPLDQLALSGQCGFSSTVEGNALTRDEQIAKLALVVETAQEVWG